MLKAKIMLHNAQIEKAKQEFKANPKVLVVIDNMQHLIDELLKENAELESIINEDNNNMVGRI